FCICFFFFSSRRRHTRSLRDWSSDVCSSDLRRLCGAGDLRHRDDVVHGRFRIQEVEDRRRRKAAVEAHAEARGGKGGPQQRQESAQQAQRAARGGGVAWPQNGRTEILLALVVEGEERQQRQIAPAVVVPVEE